MRITKIDTLLTSAFISVCVSHSILPLLLIAMIIFFSYCAFISQSCLLSLLSGLRIFTTALFLIDNSRGMINLNIRHKCKMLTFMLCPVAINNCALIQLTIHPRSLFLVNKYLFGHRSFSYLIYILTGIIEGPLFFDRHILESYFDWTQ